jgi:hypothetical protein
VQKTITFYIFIIVIFSINQALAYNFESFQIKGALKTLNKGQESRSRFNAKNDSKDQKVINARREIARKLLGMDEVGNLSLKENSSNENYSLIFKKIKQLIGNPQILGDNETAPLVYDHQHGGRVQNFSGLSWHRPQSNFLLHANREVLPDLMSDKWIVHDTLIITIDASTLLTNMKELDLIEVTDEIITIYAGMGFQRKYHFWHFADSYLDGLSSDYKKLFLSFSYFNNQKSLNLSPYEIIKRNDKFYLNVGGAVNTPPYYGVSFRGGVIANTSYQSNLTIQSLGKKDSKKDKEFLRVSIDKSHSLGADITLGLQLDFFNLLKLSLLSYELDYDYAKSQKTHFSFYENDKDELLMGIKKAAYKKVLKTKTSNYGPLNENIIQNDERESQNLSSTYALLLYGKIRKSSTEQIKVQKDNEYRYFYKHYSSSVKIFQNLWSRIFNTALYKLFDLDLPNKNAAKSTKKMQLEFEQNSDIEENFLQDESQFSFVLNQSFSAAKTHKWYHKKYLKESIRYLNRYTSLDKNLMSMLKDKYLRGPLEISSNLRVEASGLKFFHSLSENEAFGKIVDACKANNKSAWTSTRSREKLMRRFYFGKNKCVKALGKRYLSYIRVFHYYDQIDLKKFKKFLGQYFKKSRGYIDLIGLFGVDNVFIHGDFRAITQDGQPFQNYFKSGQFRGLGVIDSFMRQGATAVPISIRN